MTANPALNDLDFNALPTIDLSQLDAIIGGAGWGETIGGWVGAGLGGAGGFVLGAPFSPIVQAGTSAAGAAMGYEGGQWVGRQVDRWIGGGQQQQQQQR